MPKIGKIQVPNEINEGSKILFIGEAPGRCETGECDCPARAHPRGKPFVGAAGQLLDRFSFKVGIKRDSGIASYANLSLHRPSGNKFENLFDIEPHAGQSEELSEGLVILEDTIKKLNPNLIIALGNWPMYFLTGNTGTKNKPGTGIMNWRGSIVPSLEGRKVLCTLHPANIARISGYGNHPLFGLDLKKAAREMAYPEIRSPVYESLIDPLNVRDIVKEMSGAEWLSVDIETFGDSLACVGFSDSDERGLCITFQNPEGFHAAFELLDSPPKKIFQYGAFDINYLHERYGVETRNYAFDTYIATANLLPEFPRGLDFLTSIYTDFPFYKEERKTWKMKGDLNILWEYNIKDDIATRQIAIAQMKGLRELYGT